MRIYTRTGDDGTTGLIGGRRVGKDAPRIDAYGEVDETNAQIGLARCALTGFTGESADAVLQLDERLGRVQGELFVVGSHLAAPEGGTTNVHLPPLTAEMIERLERDIDAADKILPPLRTFILPGGSEAAARLHVARCVCRRAERSVVHLATLETVPAEVSLYLNRLSDWIFTQSRLANHFAGVADVPWVSQPQAGE